MLEGYGGRRTVGMLPEMPDCMMAVDRGYNSFSRFEWQG
jgi:hypothetical protein